MGASVRRASGAVEAVFGYAVLILGPEPAGGPAGAAGDSGPDTCAAELRTRSYAGSDAGTSALVTSTLVAVEEEGNGGRGAVLLAHFIHRLRVSGTMRPLTWKVLRSISCSHMRTRATSRRARTRVPCLPSASACAHAVRTHSRAPHLRGALDALEANAHILQHRAHPAVARLVPLLHHQ